MKVEFKIATIDDIEGIIKLCNECFNENTNLDYAKNIYLQNQKSEFSFF